MKNFLVSLIAVLITGTTLIASNIGDETLSLIKNEVLILSLEDKDQKALIVSTKYNHEEKYIAMEFENELVMVQLYNSEGEIEMMFPVSSNKVNLGLSLFETGSYKMGFMIDGESKIQFANISIN